jgi:hypothetical protein
MVISRCDHGRSNTAGQPISGRCGYAGRVPFNTTYKAESDLPVTRAMQAVVMPSPRIRTISARSASLIKCLLITRASLPLAPRPNADPAISALIDAADWRQQWRHRDCRGRYGEASARSACSPSCAVSSPLRAARTKRRAATRCDDVHRTSGATVCRSACTFLGLAGASCSPSPQWCAWHARNSRAAQLCHVVGCPAHRTIKFRLRPAQQTSECGYPSTPDLFPEAPRPPGSCKCARKPERQTFSRLQE